MLFKVKDLVAKQHPTHTAVYIAGFLVDGGRERGKKWGWEYGRIGVEKRKRPGEGGGEQRKGGQRGGRREGDGSIH